MKKPQLSIVIPTYNERDNVQPLLQRIFQCTEKAKIAAEVLFIDDNSPDGTARLLEKFASSQPVRVYIRQRREGPGPAIVDGIKLAQAPIICVMDADLSHPPETLAPMYQLIKNGQALLVIGSRQTQGGGTAGWSWYRNFFSRGAQFIGHFLTPVKDLTSGYFMFSSSILQGVEINPTSCKIGLELMVKGNHQGRVLEYPIIFSERAAGSTKMSWREAWRYLRHLLELSWYRWKHH